MNIIIDPDQLKTYQEKYTVLELDTIRFFNCEASLLKIQVLALRLVAIELQTFKGFGFRVFFALLFANLKIKKTFC